MKIKIKLLIGTLLMMGCHIVITGCSSEELLTDNNQQEEQTPSDNNNNSQDNSSNPDDTEDTNPETPEEEIPEEYVRMTFTSDTKSKQGRASVVESSNNGGTNTLRWDAGDEVIIWTGEDFNNLKPLLFETKNGGHGSAKFEYVGYPASTKTYFGIHNATYFENEKQTRFVIPTGNDDEPLCQTKKNSSIHLNKYRPMYTETQYREENSNTLTGLYFKHLSSLLVFNIINESNKEATVSSIKTKALTGTPFYNVGVRLVAEVGQSRTNQPTIPVEAKLSNFIMLKLGENSTGLKSGVNETFQAYLSLLPAEFKTQPTDLEFELNINGKEVKALGLHSSKIKNQKFEAGTYYRINLRIKPDETVEFISIETGIEEWENGGNIVIPVD